MKDVIDVFKSLTDETRLRILNSSKTENYAFASSLPQ